MLQVGLEDLLAYTDWQRTRWHALLQQHGAAVLTTSAGPHGDGRFAAVGDLIRHIFSAETRYVERLEGRALTDTTSLPVDNLDRLFAFGRESRQKLRHFIDTFPADKWDVPQDFPLMNSRLTATPRKIVLHVVTHEIRHWAQVATLLRLRGVTGELQDLLFSPVLGGEFIRAARTP
jgi:uncharacterized damage-inducible protein DinB